jgi:multidrug resistance efflux pump
VLETNPNARRITRRARVTLTALVIAAACAPSVASALAGTGNAITLSLGFQSQGPIARIAVRAGDHVRAGELLAQVDASQARIGVATAEAGVQNARAALLHLTLGPTRAERAQNRVALAQVREAVRTAVRACADAAAIARRTRAQKRQVLAQARLRLNIAEAASAQSAAVLQAALDGARAQLATVAAAAADAAALQVAQEAVANALNAQAAGAISDRQTVADATGAVLDAADDLAGEITSSRATGHQLREAVRTARLAVRATEAANAVAAQRPSPDAFALARAGIRTAQSTLAAARLTLSQTELRAPMAGTIVTVNGHVGETPGQRSDGASGTAGFITMIGFEADGSR